MDRKGSRGSNLRAGRQKKRKFRGNRYTTESDTSFTSASAAKLKKTGDEEIIIENNFGYCILEFCSFFTTLSSLVLCAECKQEIKFSRTAPRGLGFKIALECSCEDVRYVQSSPFVNKAFEINRRIVTAMRLLGVGREGINIFCSIMDICQGLSISTYNGCLDNLHWAANKMYEHIISKAVNEEQELLSKSEPNVDSTHLTVSGDGTWKKRGFSSLFGITSLIGKYNNKVVDTVVKSSFCQDCNEWKNKKNSDIQAYNDWYQEHEDLCTINHKGSAGKMEVDAVVEMFNRSVEKHGVKYVKYIGDGDSKTFKDIVDMNPYDNDPIVEKKECVGHLQQRMGAMLRKVRKENKDIGDRGDGELTDTIINELSSYYGLAIRRIPNSIKNMKNEIWAPYYHKSSSDQNPQHMYCPPGSSSWCQWQKAVAENTLDQFVHESPPLNDEVLKLIKPIYENLSFDDLLHRCLGSETQKNNESLNSLIWTFAPKHIHAGTRTIEIANYLAVMIFNEGFLSILQIMKLMGITVGTDAHTFAVRRNEDRIDRTELRASAAFKDARAAHSDKGASKNANFEVEEGPMYGSGIAD